jgi:hypothetical protein
MTTNTNILTDGHLIIDNSSLALVKMCPLMARYKLIDKRERAVTTAKGRGPGKALHSWMETYYEGVRVGSDVEAVANATLSAAYTDLPLTEGDAYLHLARMQEVTGQYLHGCRYEMGPDGRNGVYEHQGWAGREPWEVLGVEVPFAVRLGNVRSFYGQNDNWPDPVSIPITYIGRSDLVVRMRERGELMCVDHKTARRWTGADVNHWRRDAGLTGYAACISQWVREGISELPASVQAAMQAHEPLRERLAAAGVGEGLHGFIVNALVIRDVSDLRRCKEPPTAFHRETYYQDTGTLAEWRLNTLRWCEAWLGWCARGEWPENTNNCTRHFGGNCPYYEVDTLPPGKQRQVTLESDLYQDSTWSPIVRATDNDN